MYDPADFAVPEAFTRNDWTPPPHVQGVIAARESGQANLRGMAAIGCSPREAQEAQALTCGMISMIDAAVGRVQTALERSGRQSETVKLFTTDHGDHLGDHRLLFKGPEQYEAITRVPFIWSDPDGASGARSDRLGQTHDIGATILERARIEPAWGMQGLDLFGEETRPAAFVQYSHQKPMDGLAVRPNIHTVRDARYRLSVVQGMGWGELYDLDDDPGEFDNLWDDPAAQTIKAKLLETLAQAELRYIDQTPMPTGQA